MSKELDSSEFKPGLNSQTADWVNGQHERMEKGTKLLMDIALSIGEVLTNVQMSHSETFAEWIDKNIKFSRPTAYRYISLFNHRDQISGAENINAAYKTIDTLEAQKKQSETAKAYERVEEYRKTGVKPEGWRRGTDDKLAKEESDRDSRVEAVKREALAKNDGKAEKEREKERRKAETDGILNFLDRSVNSEQKRSEFKEKIRLSAEGKKDPFLDALIDYLDGLENDSRRIEACYNIIKICKKTAADLQSK